MITDEQLQAFRRWAHQHTTLRASPVNRRRQSVIARLLDRLTIETPDSCSETV
jgi:hypothetical protein